MTSSLGNGWKFYQETFTEIGEKTRNHIFYIDYYQLAMRCGFSLFYETGIFV